MAKNLGRIASTHFVEKTIKVDADGNETTESIVTESRVEKEPHFIKTYHEALFKLNDLTAAQMKVMLIITKHMGYGNNLIFTALPLKQVWSHELDIKISTINKAIDVLNSKGLIIRKSKGFYLVNPNYFAKGSWKEVKQLKLELTFNKGEQMTIKSNINEAINDAFELPPNTNVIDG